MSQISYTVDFKNPENHYCHITVDFTAKDDNPIVGMPVWAPGSYLVREFSKSMEQLESNLDFKKIRKNQWQLNAKKGEKCSFSYAIYGNEVSVRTNMIDESHAFLSPTATFVYVKGQEAEAHEVKVNLPKNWSSVACGLQETASDLSFSAENYDILADAPVEVGNHEEFTFNVQGVKHRVAMVGENNADNEKLAADMKKIVETTIDVWGTLPIKKYLFIVEHVESGGGGLEHLNSTVLMMSRNNYTNPDKYVNFLSLVAHEYFHLWNVKRLRPKELGPFDYDNENYTELLWFFEGFTAYYDELLLWRSGFVTEEEYLKRLSVNVERTENRPGVKVQTLAEASYDAWIKAYRSNENSANTTISYYGKGSLVALALDIELTHATKGRANLDDLMRDLYSLYLKDPRVGITHEDIVKSASKIAGRDLNNDFKSWVYSTDAFDYKTTFQKVGMDFTALQDKEKVELGTSTKIVDGKLLVQSVKRGTGAYAAGINAGDELVSINGERIREISSSLSQFKVRDKIEVVIFRDGIELKKEVVLGHDIDYQVEIKRNSKKINKNQTLALAKWLSKGD